MTALPTAPTRSTDERPGDRFERSTTWAQVLEPDGWLLHHTASNGEVSWTRPGKDKREGSSATTGHSAADSLHVLTSSVAEFDADTAFTRFGYFATTRHSGDLGLDQ